MVKLNISLLLQYAIITQRITHKMAGFSERLRYLLNRDEITAYRVWKDTAITKGTIGNYLENKTTPNKANVALLASYFKVNEEWLSTGNGSIELENSYNTGSSDTYLVTKSGVKYYEMANNRFRMRVPLIPIKAYAKYIDEYRDADFLDDSYEEFDFIVDKIGHGRYFAFEIKGDSMDNDSRKSLSDGDIVLARELAKEHWNNKLHTKDYPNWIIVLDGTVLCKQIVKHDLENKKITCHSLNPSPEYADFHLELHTVRQLCNIVQRVSSSF